MGGVGDAQDGTREGAVAVVLAHDLLDGGPIICEGAYDESAER